jgi:hypothetical protein
MDERIEKADGRGVCHGEAEANERRVVEKAGECVSQIQP